MIYINVNQNTVVQPSYGPVIKIVIVVLCCYLLADNIPKFYADSLNAEADINNKIVKEKEAQIKKLQVNLKKIKELEEQINDVNLRKEAILELANLRKQPVIVLDVLRQLHFEGIGIEKMDFRRDKLEISGWSEGHFLVSKYIKRLQSINNEVIVKTPEINIEEYDPNFISVVDEKNQKIDTEEENVDPEINQETEVAQPNFSNVILEKSGSSSSEDVYLYKFKLNFNPNIKVI